MSRKPLSLPALALAAALLVPSSGALAQDANGKPQALAAALARQRDAETLSRLTGDGQLLYSRDRVKLDGYQYCSQAVALAERGEFRESIRAASKALHLGLEGGNDDLVAVSKRDLAIAYSYAGNLTRAEQYAHEALQHEARNPQIVAGPVYKVLGDVAIRRGSFKEGIGYYRQALAAASERYKPLVEISLANAYVQGRDLVAARALYEQIPEPENRTLRQFFERGRGQLLLAEGKPREALALFQQAVEDASGIDAEYHRLWAFEGIGRSHLALGDKAEARKAFVTAVGLSDDVRARFRSDEFKTGLFGDLQQVFEQAILLTMEAGDTVGALELSEKSRARALLDIVRERVALGGQDASGLSAAAVDAATIRSSLKPGEALVEYHSLGDRLLAWVVRPDRIVGVTIPEPRAELARRVEEFRQAILDRKAAAKEMASGLHRTLIEPLGLKAGERLVVVPHGPLHYLPFQALRGEDAYLIERHPIAIAPSASVAMQLLAKGQERMARLVAFGNPEIDEKYDLPGSQREVEKISGLFPERKVFLRREANKLRFLESAAESRILHVATHAEVDPVDPLYSRILLAGEGRQPDFLEAREVFDLNLSRVGLVTLSACESGLGKVERGDEILGFTRSFLSAGAGSLIVSLWPVADESTELLMTTLYGELAKGADLARAMQTAQLAVLKHPRYGELLFWAPFNLIGDWRERLPG